MNKKLIFPILVIVALLGFASFISLDKPAKAAYLFDDSIPGSSNQTLRYNNGGWEASGALTNDGTNIFVTGSVNAGSFIYSASDIRLKTNIVEIDNALEKVKALRGVSFDWRKNGEHEVGLIAQEVEQVVPEFVVTNNEGIKGIKYGNVVALLIEAIKAQQVEIDALKAELENLK